MVVATELEAGDAERGEAVEVLAVEVEVEDREPLGREELRAGRLEPGERLADAADEALRKTGDVLRPGARGQHEPVCVDDPTVGRDADAVLPGRPLEHPLTRPHCGPFAER